MSIEWCCKMRGQEYQIAVVLIFKIFFSQLIIAAFQTQTLSYDQAFMIVVVFLFTLVLSFILIDVSQHHIC